MMQKNPNSKILSLFFMLFLLFGGYSLIIPSVNAVSEPLSVVSSTALVKDFVENIGGDLVDVANILVEGNEDPHTYEVSPSEVNALINADVFFLMGLYDIEPWWEGESGNGYNETVLQDNPDLIVVKILNESMVETDPLTGHENSHSWMSPIYAKLMCENIYNGLLSLISIENRPTLTAQYHAYLSQLDILVSEIQGNETIYNNTKIVVHHPSMMYLYDLLGLDRIAAIEEQHDVEPSAQHIQEIKNLMVEQECHLIVHQANLDEDQVMQIARDTNSLIIYAMPLIGIEGYNGQIIDNYLDLIRYNINALANPQTPSSDGGDNTIDGFSIIIFGTTGIITLVVINMMILTRKRNNS